MRDIEKNDVNVEQLFKWKKAFTIDDNLTNESITLYMRLIGDADVGKARAYALRQSANLRKALKTPDSDERVSSLIESLEFKEDTLENLINLILLLKLEDLQTRALRDIDIPQPIQPDSDAGLEEQEDYQKEIDDYPKKFAEAVTEKARELEDIEKKRLESLEFDKLYKEYESQMINRICLEEMSNRFYEMASYYGTYRDKRYKYLAFPSFEAFQNAATPLKERLIIEYKNLELGMGTLKKLPEATE